MCKCACMFCCFSCLCVYLLLEKMYSVTVGTVWESCSTKLYISGEYLLFPADVISSPSSLYCIVTPSLISRLWFYSLRLYIDNKIWQENKCRCWYFPGYIRSDLRHFQKSIYQQSDFSKNVRPITLKIDT